ncbi:MAG TPA: 3-isopropylmalate dehydratase small subunit [Miltoncostaeaceae bacterium]|jgi:3-isopropylmalate/(R)-2-methylmalate dehydratase small subunit|nr:3-isopropylmalate dehydratase small subunit [Miltoncostaeaceae bacterium]
MDAFTRVEGVVCPLDRTDVDTDQIIPKQFLKRIERTGFGEFLFWDWRGEPGFPLDRPEYADAPILVTGRNFGCGSSREHAPWALEDHGFRAVIAPSFADIFRTNCTKIGLLPVELPEDAVRALMEQAEGEPGSAAAVDLERQVVVAADGREHPFEIDPVVRERLLNGWDDIALTLAHEDEIAAYERERERIGPTTAQFA